MVLWLTKLLATSKHSHCPDHSSIITSGISIPQLAFGLYLIPADETGVSTILNAISAGYCHFDTASYYGNERTLGNALKRSGIPRDQFFIASKVWNDAQKNKTVRTSVERSIDAINFGDYIDLYLIHWPVPGCFVDTYIKNWNSFITRASWNILI